MPIGRPFSRPNNHTSESEMKICKLRGFAPQPSGVKLAGNSSDATPRQR
ncbi:hypothetical protein PLANPX_2130 [Lacipirellula parvula]|uniref:Uncharacterized protein n=1 Tax=Lacipirellula parvula TaxID=2650471 RepID=A0A5K7X7I6_9BACT|nr:hypothetical protein PLANPX_2130 [Lacipirellula parvula]